MSMRLIPPQAPGCPLAASQAKLASRGPHLQGLLGIDIAAGFLHESQNEQPNEE